MFTQLTNKQHHLVDSLAQLITFQFISCFPSVLFDCHISLLLLLWCGGLVLHGHVLLGSFLFWLLLFLFLCWWLWLWSCKNAIRLSLQSIQLALNCAQGCWWVLELWLRGHLLLQCSHKVLTNLQFVSNGFALLLSQMGKLLRSELGSTVGLDVRKLLEVVWNFLVENGAFFAWITSLE